VSALRPGDVLENRYRIDELLGEGGMSWVYRGHHLLLEQPVAVKVIKPLHLNAEEARALAEQQRLEASIMARLDHPNLVRAFDMFSHGEQAVLILEMVLGRNLEEVAELAPRPISERRVLAWTAQILDALEYLHSQSPPVIVRDLKPANVMLGQDGRIRLIDFGLAKRLDPQGSGTRDIVRGMGSEGFAPLEQYAHASTDGRTDLYALGATMYFLLSKIVPPPATLRASIDTAPLLDPRSVNPSIGDATWAALQALLALKASDRPPHAAAAREALGLPQSRASTHPRGSSRAGSKEPATPPGPRAPGKRCAVCDLLLRPVMSNDVEIDCCNECGGVWLDRGELARLVELGREQPERPSLKHSSFSPGRSAGFRSSNESNDLTDSHDLPDSDDLSDSHDLRHRRARSEGSGRGRQDSGSRSGRSGLYQVWRMLEKLFD
jgi:serine/threonine-protein kinase